MRDAIIANIVLFGSFLALMATGFPVAFCLAGIGVVGLFFYLGWGGTLGLVHLSIIDTTNFWVLYTIPLFIFLGCLMEKSGLAEDIYRGLRLWTQSLPGGLAVATVLLGTLVGCISGESSASVVTEGIICLPPMEKYKYDKNLTMGCILGAAGLDIIIPPSVLMIVYVITAEVSIGRMWAGGYLPGLLLGGLYIAYIIVRCLLNPALGPVIPPEERVGWKEKLASLKYLIPPVFLIFAILGSVFGGILAPSESAALGCSITLVWGVVSRRLKWRGLLDSCYTTLRLTTMIMWIIITAKVFKTLYFFSGAGHLGDYIAAISMSKWTGIIVVQAILLFLGFFLDPFVIIMLIMPIVKPLIDTFGLNPIWFGELFMINMILSLVTPPVGLNIFYFKSVTPEGTTMQDLYASAIPFAILTLIGLVLVIIFPQIVLWLPNLIYGK